MTGKPTLDEALETAMRDDDLIPSSGFVDAVMSAVRTDAATPPPIAFPWARVWPAAVLAAALTAAPVVIALSRPTPATGLSNTALADVSGALIRLLANPDFQLAGMAIALTGLLVVLPSRLLSSR